MVSVSGVRKGLSAVSAVRQSVGGTSSFSFRGEVDVQEKEIRFIFDVPPGERKPFLFS